jgi:hypothetical protein
MASNSLSIAAFTALGTIVGYLGAEVACESIFARLLWPNRFYNTTDWRSLLAMAVLMPLGGPIHAAAVATLDTFAESGLWKGYCRGDMLGTAFYPDSKLFYVEHGIGTVNASKEARNSFWAQVMRLAPWSVMGSGIGCISGPTDDEDAREKIATLRAQRPVFVLGISRDTQTPARQSLPILDGDLGPLKFRHILGLVVSETITLSVGIVVAAVWHSYFSIWFLLPLVIKLLAALCQVPREPMNVSSENNIIEPLRIYEMTDISNGFFLIEDQENVAVQFFRHYGHPRRHRRGLRGDRVREVLSMVTVVLCATVFPSGIIAFVFASQEIQWLWLGYELYTMLVMHIYRFSDGKSIGSTQQEMARLLGRRKPVRFVDSQGIGVIAVLSGKVVENVTQGRIEVQQRLAEIRDRHEKH